MSKGPPRAIYEDLLAVPEHLVAEIINGEAAVSHVWLVDPVLQTLEALRLELGAYRLLGTWRGGVKVRVEPFDAVELALGSIPARPHPRCGGVTRSSGPS
jgi:hypothetical protein